MLISPINLMKNSNSSPCNSPRKSGYYSSINFQGDVLALSKKVKPLSEFEQIEKMVNKIEDGVLSLCVDDIKSLNSIYQKSQVQKSSFIESVKKSVFPFWKIAQEHPSKFEFPFAKTLPRTEEGYTRELELYKDGSFNLEDFIDGENRVRAFESLDGNIDDNSQMIITLCENKNEDPEIGICVSSDKHNYNGISGNLLAGGLIPKKGTCTVYSLFNYSPKNFTDKFFSLIFDSKGKIHSINVSSDDYNRGIIFDEDGQTVRGSDLFKPPKVIADVDFVNHKQKA